MVNNGMIRDLPSGNLLQFAIENGPVEIVDLPIKNMVIVHSFLYVYQRVIHFSGPMLTLTISGSKDTRQARAVWFVFEGTKHLSICGLRSHNMLEGTLW